MKQREVTDSNNLTWLCVQPFSGSKQTEDIALEKMTNENSEIEIVCTPTKAEQSKRIKVNKNWLEDLSDEDLIKKISQ